MVTKNSEVSFIDIVTNTELKELLDRFLSGDPDAETALLGDLESIARRLLSVHLSPKFLGYLDDVVQEAIWSAFKYLRECRDNRSTPSEIPHSVAVWMRAIVICRANDFFRRWYRQNPGGVNLESLDSLSNCEDRQSAEQREIEAFVDSLTDSNEQDVVRCILAGLNWLQTRQLLDISERGMRDLRNSLGKKLRAWLGMDELREEEDRR